MRTLRTIQPVKPLWIVLLILCTSVVQLGCSKPQLAQQESFVFGTRVEITVADAQAADAQAGISAVLHEFDRLHRQYHAWQPSELQTLNTAIAQGKPLLVSAELAELIREAQMLARQGNFLFDPGIGQLIALWGFQADEFQSQLPDNKLLTEWVASHPSIADLEIDTQQVVRSRNRRVALDFGGYLKGWALDRAEHILREHHIQHALINIGGNILAMGNKFGKPWTVGIQNPRGPGALGTIELRDGEAIGTSGDYQRFFELNGKRYPHILDPRTGHPADQTQAVTVLIPSSPRAGTRSDASSKPIFIAGSDSWRAAAQFMGVQSVLRIDADGTIQATPEMKLRLKKVTAQAIRD